MGQPLMPHQRLMLDVGLEFDPITKLPAYREVRITVPRRSGKTTVLLVVQVDRSLAWGRHQRSLYVAQTRIDSRKKWEEQTEMLRDSQLAGLFEVRRQTGFEETIWTPTRSTVGITAAMETSGHGFDLDLGQIDEAWAQRDSRLVQAFRPAMMSRPAAQLWITSTMGTDESEFWNGLVDDGRARVDADERSGVAYFEWSAGDQDDPDDPDTWLRCMPAIGHTVDLDTIKADHATLPADEFARAYLNRRQSLGRPVIDAATWATCRDPSSTLSGLPCFSIDVTPDRSYAAIGVSGWRADRKRHVEIVDHRPGTDWVISRARELEERWRPLPFVIDPSSPAGSLLVDLDAVGVPTETTTTREYSQACGQFYDAVYAGSLVHLGQPALDSAIGVSRKRPVADSWAWARKAGGDISPLVAATLSSWGLMKAGQGSLQIL